MGRNIKVLFVDDNRDVNFFAPLADNASLSINCDLIPVYTWEDAVRILDESPYEYHGLILDGKGQKSEKSKSEDDSFLNLVLKNLHERANKGNYLPYVIYSGWADELRKYYDGEPIFWKGKNEERQMLDHLKQAIGKSETYKCRQLYPDIFEVFDLNLLHSKYEPELVNIVNLTYNNFTGNSEVVFRCIRPIFENTFHLLNEFDGQLVAPKYFSKGSPNISGISRYLAGSPTYNKTTGEMEFPTDKVISLPLYYLLVMLQDVTSSTAMHHFDKKPSEYLIRTCTNALIEYLLWYKQFIKDNYSK